MLAKLALCQLSSFSLEPSPKIIPLVELLSLPAVPIIHKSPLLVNIAKTSLLASSCFTSAGATPVGIGEIDWNASLVVKDSGTTPPWWPQVYKPSVLNKINCDIFPLSLPPKEAYNISPV